MEISQVRHVVDHLKVWQIYNILEKTRINQNYINEDLKNRLKSENACYLSIQNFSSSKLLSKNIKIIIHRTVILPAVLYGSET
jgi:hypothetical protein